MSIHPTALSKAEQAASLPALRSRGRKAVALPRCGHRSEAATLRSSAAGFTLLEVIAAMALIVFVIGGVYGLGASTMKLGASLSSSRIVETRITNFISAWREYLESLPPGIRFDASARGIFIENSQVPFAWNRASRRADAVEFTLGEKSAQGGDFTVRHLKRPQQPVSPDEFKLISELPILEGLRECGWQFYEPLEKKWLSDWDSKKLPQPPLFMRLKFAFIGDPRSFEHTFWISGGFVTPANPSPAQPAAPGQAVQPGIRI